MSITRLEFSHLRNIDSLNLEAHPQLNIISGDNGSGKTSFLEGLYLLGRGRSFRTNKRASIIQKNKDCSQLFSLIRSPGSTDTRLGVELCRKSRRFRLNGDDLSKSADLARILPLQFLNQTSFALVDQGPAVRRKFLDWGVFHVEHTFYSVWQHYQRALQQRNAALRNRAQDLQAWTEECAQAANPLHEMRKNYISRLEKAFFQRRQHLLPQFEIEMRYLAGWQTETSLSETYKLDRGRDMHRGFTHSGPHRADLAFFLNSEPVVEHLSRGQQKLLVSALVLAQADVYTAICEKPCIILADDLSAELDENHTSLLLKALVKTGAQVFLTVTNEKKLGELLVVPHKLFHVKQGDLREAEVLQ